MKRGGAFGPHKGRFAVHRRVNSYACILFSSIYAYQFSAFYLDKQTRAHIRDVYSSESAINNITNINNEAISILLELALTFFVFYK